MAKFISAQSFFIKPDETFLQTHVHLPRLTKQLAIKFAFNEMVSEEDIKNMGNALWQALQVDEPFAKAKKKAGAAILPIIVESDDSAVQMLPWELLTHPEMGFLGKHPAFTFSRKISLEEISLPPVEKGPLRVLLFSSMPDDVDAEKSRLNVEEEEARVQEALHPLIAEGKVILEAPGDGRFEVLQESIRSFQPHLVFLSGHGKFYDESLLDKGIYSVFLFEGDYGESVPVPHDKIAQAFAGSYTQCVVFSACESSKAASDALTAGLAQHLSDMGIPHVIGMRESIHDQEGIQFACTFCDEVARGERIDTALQSARNGMEQYRIHDETGKASPQPEWSLPVLYAHDVSRMIIDWNFPAVPVIPENNIAEETIDGIPLPQQFIGRRSDVRAMRQFINRENNNKILIRAPGGRGKTALAGKIVDEFRKKGYTVFAWQAQGAPAWQNFLTEIEFRLEEAFRKDLDRNRPTFLEDEETYIRFLLDALMKQYQGKLLLYLDNLESIQNPQSGEVEEQPVAAFLRVAASFPALILVGTSRWDITDWPGQIYPLPPLKYADFLPLSRQYKLPADFAEKRILIRNLFDATGGNPRGLEFAAGAFSLIPQNATDADDEESIKRVMQELQKDMGIAFVYQHLSEAEKKLLARMPNYRSAVPEEGIFQLLESSESELQQSLQKLCAVSFVEILYEPQWQVRQYQCVPLVETWLAENDHVKTNENILATCAQYQAYLFHYERSTLAQVLLVHESILRAGQVEKAGNFVLDYIVGIYSLVGMYKTLLEKFLLPMNEPVNKFRQGEWLEQIGTQYLHLADFSTAENYIKRALQIMYQNNDKAGEGSALNNLSQIYASQGDYDTALSYLDQSLQIAQQTGNKASEGTTLNNIANIFHEQGNYDTTLSYHIQSLQICQQIGNKVSEGITLNNISQVFKAQEKYDTALLYLKQSLQICQQIGNFATEASILNNISQIYTAKGDNDTALNYLKQSLQIWKKIGNKTGLCSTLFNIGYIHAQNMNFQEATDTLVTAYTIAKEINDAKTLHALSDLASLLDLPLGVKGWEMLAQLMNQQE